MDEIEMHVNYGYLNLKFKYMLQIGIKTLKSYAYYIHKQ